MKGERAAPVGHSRASMPFGPKNARLRKVRKCDTGMLNFKILQMEVTMEVSRSPSYPKWKSVISHAFQFSDFGSLIGEKFRSAPLPLRRRRTRNTLRSVTFISALVRDVPGAARSWPPGREASHGSEGRGAAHSKAVIFSNFGCVPKANWGHPARWRGHIRRSEKGAFGIIQRGNDSCTTF